MKSVLIRVYRKKLVQDAAALYGVQLTRKILPLILVPFLARVLGPAGWGLVAFMQSLGEFIVLLVEFGFNLSGTREIARRQDDRQACGEIMTGVLSAQVLLATLGIGAASLAAYFIPILHNHPRLVLAGFAYAIAQGFAPLWLFQGLEKMKLAAGLEIAGKLLGCTCVLLFVHSAQDDWKVLALQALAPGLTTVGGIFLALRAVPLVRPRMDLLVEALRRGWPMFLFRSGESLYGVGNAFILGLFVPATFVGYFAGADKITRAAFGLLLPIREVLFPRLSKLAYNSRQQAARLARSGVVLMGGGGILLGIVQFTFAPYIVGFLMGKGFEPAVAVLRIESLFPVFLGFTYSVGLQWLIPLGRDALVNRTIIAAGVINITMASLLAPRLAHVGMALSVVTAEAFVCITFVSLVYRTMPFWGERSIDVIPEPAGALTAEEFVETSTITR